MRALDDRDDTVAAEKVRLNEREEELNKRVAAVADKEKALKV